MVSPEKRKLKAFRPVRKLPVIGAAVFGLLFLFIGNAHAGNRIDLKVDKTTLSMGDVLRCEVVVTLENEDSVSDIRQPTFQDFKVLDSQTGTQQYTSIVNFKVTSKKTTTTTSLLQPTKLGQFEIGPATFRENGQLVSSNRVSVTVQDLKAESGGVFYGDNAISAPLSEHEQQTPTLFLRLVPERGELFVGEQIAVTLYLYSSGVSVSRWGRVAIPDFEGFASESLQMPSDGDARRVIIDRRDFHVEALDRYLLTARKTGKQTISPYTAKILAGGDGLFGGRWYNRGTTPVEISVNPLPQKGRPKDFAPGSVGKFRLHGRLDRRRTETGQPVTLTVILEGSADINRVLPPKLPPLPDAKVYPPTEKRENFQQGLRLSGRYTAEYLVVPNRSGRLRIPPLTFSYYDVDERKYKTARTPEFSVFVKESGASGDSGTLLSPTAKQDLVFEPGSLQPLHPRAEFRNRGERFFGSSVFLALFWGPLILISLLLFYDAVRWLRPRLSASGKLLLEREIRELEIRLSDGKTASAEAFHADVKRWVYLELELRTGANLAGSTHDQLVEKLSKAGISEGRRTEAVRLLETADFLRYGRKDEAGRARLVADIKTWKEALRK